MDDKELPAATNSQIMNKQKRKEIFARLKSENPEPTTELHYTTPFELLIAVILSAQATDVSVNKATDILFAVANTPKAILKLGEKGLKKYIKTIGLYNTKGKNIIKTCKILLDEHNGEVPDNQQALEALAGVGRKTANVVRNTAFGHPTIAVDTHIFRVSNRTRIAPGKTVLEVTIPKINADQLYAAPNKDGVFRVYIRVNDENLIVNNIYKLKSNYEPTQRSSKIRQKTKTSAVLTAKAILIKDLLPC